MGQTDTHGSLLVQARNGHQKAWAELVDRMSPLVWSVARSFRLDHATASDVVQIVWLRLLENCDRIEEPECLPGWLAVTCRRQALAAVNAGKRVTPTEFKYDVEDLNYSVESIVTQNEDAAAVKAAFDQLSDDDQQILRLSVLQPELSYQEISQVIGRPVGSIGPTRGRALERLKAAMDQAGVGV
jgi:RNA polymerase sigma factor (sigma-70 family)